MITKPKAIELAEKLDNGLSWTFGDVSAAAAELRRLSALEQQGEPFGYFCAYAFGWTDCAATDEGAIALYEHPVADLTDEQIMEIEKSSYVEARRPVQIKDCWGDEVTTWEPTRHFNYFMFARTIIAKVKGVA